MEEGEMFTQPKWLRENFALSHAFAGVCAYGLAVLVVNLDKSLPEIVVLVARQAVVTFMFTGLLVPVVQRLATSKRLLPIFVFGILMPAAIVAISSTVAHAYWSDEKRNILAPFLVSVVLNSFLVAARRAGNETFTTQLRWLMQRIGLVR